MGRGRNWALVAACAVALAAAALFAIGCGDGGNEQADRSELIEKLRERVEAAKAEGGAPAGSQGPSTAATRIEEFGTEAGGAERKAMLAVFRGYLDAVAAGDYPAACSQLASGIRKLLGRVGSSAGSKPPSCARALARIAKTALDDAAQKADGKIVAVRVEDDGGYVIFRAPGADLYSMRVTREGGEWRAGAVAAATLVPSS